MKSRVHIVTLAACAAAALGSQGAQAHLLYNSDSSTAVESTSSQSVLATMVAAGTRYHAAANYRDEKSLYGTMHSRKAQQSGVRPDDRAGVRGI
jgi:hypothetical protein